MHIHKYLHKPKKKRPRGRPRTGRLKFLIKLLPEIEKLARKRAAKLGIPKSHYIEELIRKDRTEPLEEVDRQMEEEIRRLKKEVRQEKKTLPKNAPKDRGQAGPLASVIGHATDLL